MARTARNAASFGDSAAPTRMWPKLQSSCEGRAGLICFGADSGVQTPGPFFDPGPFPLPIPAIGGPPPGGGGPLAAKAGGAVAAKAGGPPFPGPFDKPPFPGGPIPFPPAMGGPFPTGAPFPFGSPFEIGPESASPTLGTSGSFGCCSFDTGLRRSVFARPTTAVEPDFVGKCQVKERSSSRRCFNLVQRIDWFVAAPCAPIVTPSLPSKESQWWPNAIPFSGSGATDTRAGTPSTSMLRSAASSSTGFLDSRYRIAESPACNPRSTALV
mmetsp:Transcript_40124/g.79341  ORF Transcript_40124/g.79341 Transcript_40124/m.79341 type:complete len:270 (+) Transcript_40124:609-1418(+)